MTYVIVKCFDRGAREYPITFTDDRTIMLGLLKTGSEDVRAYEVPRFPIVSDWTLVKAEGEK